MDFTFLKASGQVAFFRSDAEQAEWTQEEFNLHCTFPLITGKLIERGMVILFQDPATNDWQAYEIRQCTVNPGDYFQQITAEDLAVSELTDCHIGERQEFNGSATSALSAVLAGTGWSIGTVNSNPNSMGNIDRGSVWQNITTISNNWNVYIQPRVTVNSTGIAGKYLDLLPSSGTDRGLRLAINKNVTDPIVTYDDTELYTALYGYGSTYSEGDTMETRVTKEINFASVAWAKTADHPAKPAGQTYLEYPEMTALYGRKGKPRFGYYQNTDIKDPGILLQKTWQTLKVCSQPKVSITGTVSDLKRLGYADQPLRLHDLAIVELEPVGILLYKQIIRLTVDLLNPTQNLPEIGDYIPNIIYINRETSDYATGGSTGTSGGRGGGGGRGGSRNQLAWSEYRTTIADNGRQIDLNAQHIDEQENILSQAGMHIDPDTGVLIYAEDNVNMIGSRFHVQSDRITAEVTERKSGYDELSSRITVTSRQIELKVQDTENRLSARITVNANQIELKVSKNGVISAINQTAEQITISASRIDLSGYVTASDLNATNATINNLVNGYTTAVSISATKLTCSNLSFAGHNIYFYQVKTTAGTNVQLMGYAQ